MLFVIVALRFVTIVLFKQRLSSKLLASLINLEAFQCQVPSRAVRCLGRKAATPCPPCLRETLRSSTVFALSDQSTRYAGKSSGANS